MPDSEHITKLHYSIDEIAGRIMAFQRSLSSKHDNTLYGKVDFADMNKI
jgi:hypothetical protein